MASKVFLVVFILATTLLLQSEAFHVGTAGDLRLGKKRDSLPGRIQVKINPFNPYENSRLSPYLLEKAVKKGELQKKLVSFRMSTFNNL